MPVHPGQKIFLSVFEGSCIFHWKKHPIRICGWRFIIVVITTRWKMELDPTEAFAFSFCR